MSGSWYFRGENTDAIIGNLVIEHNGKQYARVSEILAPFSHFSDIAPEVLKNKARIGTEVHAAIHEMVEGRFPAVSGRVLRYVQCYERWRECLKPEFLLSEARFYDDELMITGAIDALVKLQGETLPLLVDFKTSAQESPITWPMQAHLYYRLCNLQDRRIAPRFLFVRLNDKHELPTVYAYHYQENTMNRCLEAVRDFWQRITSA
jgi:hypothetical protein